MPPAQFMSNYEEQDTVTGGGDDGGFASPLPTTGGGRNRNSSDSSTLLPSREVYFTPDVLEYYSHMSMKNDSPPPKSFRVGLLTTNLDTVGRNIYAVSNPASPCVVAAVATLDTSVSVTAIREWVRKHRIGPSSEEEEDDAAEIVAKSGDEGFREIIAGNDVDAVYLSLPLEQRSDYVTTALESGKHVLVHYPVATTLSGFVSLFDKARRCGRHLQDSTTFLHHHRVTEFLGRVLGDQDSFPRIKRITASLNVQLAFLDGNVWQSNPDWRDQGCISTLARFCVMFGMLLFNRINYEPKSVQVTKVKRDSTGLPIEATCKIRLDPDCTLVIHCSYINNISVRQHVEIEADTRSASMINFVFPHHSLASYLLYEKTGKTVTRGYSIDLAGGPPQNVMLWRNFAALSRAMEDSNGARERDVVEPYSYEERAIVDAQELAHIEMQTFNIVLALMESLDQGCKVVELEPFEID